MILASTGWYRPSQPRQDLKFNLLRTIHPSLKIIPVCTNKGSGKLGPALVGHNRPRRVEDIALNLWPQRLELGDYANIPMHILIITSCRVM